MKDHQITRRDIHVLRGVCPQSLGIQKCKKILKEKGMQTLADWLRCYNILVVAPVLEVLEKMRAFYKAKGIAFLPVKDAVNQPGISLHYLLRGTIERWVEFYSPCKEAYAMLYVITKLV